MKSILIATDLSARSDRALQRAIALADEFSATLEVVHVIDDDYPEPIRRRNEEAALGAIDACLTATTGGKTVNARPKVIHGRDYEAVIRRADEISADLIVLGIHRHSDRATFRGATAERIIRFGRRPVLMVKDPCTGPFRRVIVPADLSENSRAALRLAARLAPKGQIHVIHATHAPFTGFLGRATLRQIVADEQAMCTASLRNDIERLSADLGEAAPRFDIIMKEGPVEQVVRECAAQLSPDLIALGAHSRSGIAYAIIGSMAEGLLLNAPTDILIARSS